MTTFKVSDDTEVRLNFSSKRSLVIRHIEYRLLKGVLEMSAQLAPVSVAQFLMEFPVRGRISSCEECALAEWVRAVCEAEIAGFGAYGVEFLTVDQEAIRVRILRSVGDTTEDYEIQIPIPTDGVLQRFIAEFDDGAYPDLIA